jgi:hypothetical protein
VQRAAEVRVDVQVEPQHVAIAREEVEPLLG